MRRKINIKIILKWIWTNVKNCNLMVLLFAPVTLEISAKTKAPDTKIFLSYNLSIIIYFAQRCIEFYNDYAFIDPLCK